MGNVFDDRRVHFSAPAPSSLSHDLIPSARSGLVKSSRKFLDLFPFLQKGLEARGADKELPLGGVKNKLKYSCASVPTWIFGRRRKCLTETLPIDTAGSTEQKQSLGSYRRPEKGWPSPGAPRGWWRTSRIPCAQRKTGNDCIKKM